MATVRIYKVAELLGIPSQEVLALLKSAHGIELKSASSTLEEMVARSFVERTARERKISLPSGDMFHGKAAPKGTKEGKGGKKAALAKKTEPPQPVVPVLGPPRLVKTIRPAAPPPDEDAAIPTDLVDAEATPADALEAGDDNQIEELVSQVAGLNRIQEEILARLTAIDACVHKSAEASATDGEGRARTLSSTQSSI